MATLHRRRRQVKRIAAHQGSSPKASVRPIPRVQTDDMDAALKRLRHRLAAAKRSAKHFDERIEISQDLLEVEVGY